MFLLDPAEIFPKRISRRSRRLRRCLAGHTPSHSQGLGVSEPASNCLDRTPRSLRRLRSLQAPLLEMELSGDAPIALFLASEDSPTHCDSILPLCTCRSALRLCLLCQ